MTNKTNIDKSYENFGRYVITEDEFKTLSSDEKTNWDSISVEDIVEKYDNMTGLRNKQAEKGINKMEFKEIAKRLISEKLNWSVQNIIYLCTDLNQYSFYLVYENHRIKCVAAIDDLNECVSGIWD